MNLPAGQIILSVGELIPRKGFHVLIRAFQILQQDYHLENAHLIIVGEGRYKKKLAELIQTHKLESTVHLVGAKPHCELCLWYNAADLFCLASSREGWPNVLMEAIACGLPVIATNVWGAPEIIKSDEIGFLARREPADLAQKIFMASKKQWNIRKILDYGKENSWEKTALTIDEIFKSILSEKLKYENPVSSSNPG